MPKTQNEIDEIAERVRATGTPDFLNRWLGMTPELLAETEALIARHSAADNRRRDDMARTPGPKEQALRAAREATDQAPAPKPKAAANPAKKAAGAAKPKKAAEVPADTAPAQAAGGTARRQGAKTGIIAKLLAKKNGCTAKEVMAACNWPSISMPQQAKAVGVTLYKHKGEDGVTRYADHPLT